MTDRDEEILHLDMGKNKCGCVVTKGTRPGNAYVEFCKKHRPKVQGQRNISVGYTVNQQPKVEKTDDKNS